MTLPTDRRIREVGRTVSRALVERVGQGLGKPMIVAVSGGADSSALLLLLTDTQSRHGWRVRAAHIDHGIQDDSVRRRFRGHTQALSAMAHVQLDIREVDARAEAASSSEGLEAAARRVRYEALVDVALERGAAVVAVAHTLDDQAETVLLHMLRGAGLDGLSGMPQFRPLDEGVTLVRPMLDVSRAETEAVCRAYDWEPVHDPANDDLAHTRNRVRRSLLPVMEEINPRVSQRLAQLARSLSGDRELLELIGRETLGQMLGPQDSRQEGRQDGLSRRTFMTLPGPLQVRVIRAFCQERAVVLSAERTAAALQVIHTGHGVVEMPEGYRLSVARGTVRLEETCPPAEPAG